MSELHYRHTQIGWVILIALGFAALLFASILNAADLGRISALAAAILLLVAALFATLTVTVDRERVSARFGLGLLGKTIPLADVRSYGVMRTPWYYGWGIRLIPGGWMYNVSGFWSVEFVLKDGRRVRIGSDQPEELRRAVATVIGEPAPLSAEELAVSRRAGRRFVLLAGAIVGVVVVLAAAAIYLQGRPPTVTVGAQAVEVRSFFYGGKWRLDSLTQVALETALPQVLRRTNGYALGSTLRGHFRLEGLGAAQLYIEADRHPFIVLRCGDDLLLLNHPDEQQTRALFAAIPGAWTRARGAK